MELTRRQFLALTVVTAAILALRGKALKDEKDFNECVDEGMNVQRKMGGPSYLSAYVKSQVERICRSTGRERR